MLIRLGIGSRAGHVIDMPPHEARAMLADGRATLPDALVEVAATLPSSPSVTAPGRVVHRDPVSRRRR